MLCPLICTFPFSVNASVAAIVSAPEVTLVLVASFILLYQRRKFSAAVAGLRFYGRMSLTNYLSQSVIGAFVYFPFGLYLAPRCGYTASLLVGILVFLLQVRFCKWWLGRHKQGPLEYIWHKWTWIGTDK